MKKPCERTDCFSSPIREECLDYCIDQVLRIATPQDKVSILNIPPSLAERIYEAYNFHGVNSIVELKRSIGDGDWKIVRTIFRGLSQSQLDYFKHKR